MCGSLVSGKGGAEGVLDVGGEGGEGGAVRASAGGHAKTAIEHDSVIEVGAVTAGGASGG